MNYIIFDHIAIPSGFPKPIVSELTAMSARADFSAVSMIAHPDVALMLTACGDGGGVFAGTIYRSLPVIPVGEEPGVVISVIGNDSIPSVGARQQNIT